MRQSGLFLVLVGIILSCNNIKKDTTPAYKNIDVSNLKALEKDSVIVDDIRYVNLETVKESVIGYICKIKNYNNRFFILGKDGQNGIHIFSNNGHFVGKIKNIGKGVGEFLSVSDFDISPDGTICLWDHHLEKLLFFDENLKFLNEKKISYQADQILTISSEEIMLYNVGNGDNKKQVIIYNLKSGKETILLTARKFWDTEESLPDFSHICLNRCGDKIFYSPRFSNLIYRYVDNKLKPWYKINMPNIESKESDYRRYYVLNERDKEEPESLEQTFIFENNRQIIIKLQVDGIKNIIISKKSGKMIFSEHIKPPKGFCMSDIKGSTNEEFIGYILPRFHRRSHFLQAPTGSLIEQNPSLILFKLKNF